MPDSSASRMLQNLQSSALPSSQQILQSMPAAVDPASPTAAPITPQDATPPETVPVSQPLLSDQQKLATFEAILSEVEAEKQVTTSSQSSQSITPPISQSTVPVAAPSPPAQDQAAFPAVSSRKEQEAATAVASAELPGGMQYVESEPISPEIPAEVESFLQKVEEQKVQLPQEIIAAAQEHAASTVQQQLPQHVKVLPISAAEAEIAKKKNPTFSIRWLLAFSEKLVHMFKGQAIYRSE